jgi:hypothetical protein
MATNTQTVRVANGRLELSYADGGKKYFDLPDRVNREANREFRAEVKTFADSRGATEGQYNAIVKELDKAGYRLALPYDAALRPDFREDRKQERRNLLDQMGEL